MGRILKCSCGKKLRIPDTHRGKVVQCPSCKARIPVSSQTNVEDVGETDELSGSLDELVRMERNAKEVTDSHESGAGTKIGEGRLRCPQCDRLVNQMAKQCSNCELSLIDGSCPVCGQRIRGPEAQCDHGIKPIISCRSEKRALCMACGRQVRYMWFQPICTRCAIDAITYESVVLGSSSQSEFLQQVEKTAGFRKDKDEDLQRIHALEVKIKRLGGAAAGEQDKGLLGNLVAILSAIICLPIGIFLFLAASQHKAERDRLQQEMSTCAQLLLRLHSETDNRYVSRFGKLAVYWRAYPALVVFGVMFCFVALPLIIVVTVAILW
jgi:hypothetical protein